MCSMTRCVDGERNLILGFESIENASNIQYGSYKIPRTPRYNDSICSLKFCFQRVLAAVENTNIGSIIGNIFFFLNTSGNKCFQTRRL